MLDGPAMLLGRGLTRRSYSPTSPVQAVTATPPRTRIGRLEGGSVLAHDAFRDDVLDLDDDFERNLHVRVDEARQVLQDLFAGPRTPTPFPGKEAARGPPGRFSVGGRSPRPPESAR